ncbi:MAG: 30S ribosomal protein S16, partial [Planctomycetota bacterium]
PTPKVQTLIKKYGKGGTHVSAQQQAIERLGQRRAKSIQAAIAAAANAPKAPEPSAAPAEEAAPAAEEASGGEEAAS